MSKNGVGTASKLFGSFILLISCQISIGLTGSSSFAQELTGDAVSEAKQDNYETDTSNVSPVSHDGFERNGLPDSDLTARRLTLTHVFQLTFVASVFLLGYSLLTAGKRGRGWFLLVVTYGVLAVIGKAILSLFVVVADSKSTNEWDEDESEV